MREPPMTSRVAVAARGFAGDSTAFRPPNPPLAERRVRCGPKSQAMADARKTAVHRPRRVAVLPPDRAT